MAVLIQSKSTTAPSSGSSLVITAPTGIQVGDLLICHYALNDGTDTMNTLSGWTHELANQSAGGSSKTGLQWKIADSSDAAASNFTFTLTGASAAVQGALLRISGHITSDLLNDNSQLQGNTGSPTYTATVTPLSTSALLLFFVTTNDASASPNVSDYAIANNNPTWAEEYDLGSSLTSIALASAQYTAGSATGNASASISGSGTQDSFAMVVALSAPVNVTVSPSVLTTTATLIDPTSVTGGATVSPDAITMTSSVQDPTISTPAPDWNNTSKSSSTWSNTQKS